MQEWREKYDLVGVCEDIISKCSRSTAKQLYSHVYQEQDRCILHKSVQNYLCCSYSNYYGRRQPHQTIVSAKKTHRMYQIEVDNDEKMFGKLSKNRRRRKQYPDIKYEVIDIDMVMKRSTSITNNWYGPTNNAAASKK